MLSIVLPENAVSSGTGAAAATSLAAQYSPISLADRLITLAKDAEAAGYARTAGQLVELALTIFDEAPRRQH